MVTTAMAVSSSISSGSSARPGSAALLVSGRTAAPLAPREAVQRTGRLSRRGERGLWRTGGRPVSGHAKSIRYSGPRAKFTRSAQLSRSVIPAVV